MKTRKKKGRSGESIVEVMVSVVVFLLFMAVLQAAIMFSNSALKKSLQIRQDTAEICEKLRTTVANGDTSYSYDFYATSTDGTSTSEDALFSISALKQKKEVSYTGADGNTSKVTFWLFGGNTP